MNKGRSILLDGAINRSVEFTREERRTLGLEGLLPYAVATQQLQVDRVMEGLRRKENDLERYILLNSLQDRNERLFYTVLVRHIELIMPLIYTPTVGLACQEFSHIFRRPKGCYITPDYRGRIADVLANWPEDDVRVIVVTDGQRILGLGDLGANGMGIPIGKLAIYTAAAGIQPHQCMPITLDVGTGNEALRSDPYYLGWPHARLTGDAYFQLVDEFVTAVQLRFPKALIQFEDFSTPNAYALLEKYRDRVCCFNDDIQGTAAVALAGVYASTRITGIPFQDLRVLFLGAGSAATGIAELLYAAFQEEGLSADEARARLWFVDSKGLITQSRDGLTGHKRRFAQPQPPMPFMDALDAQRPHVLIGATGAPGTFHQAVIEKMAALNERPVIFALSNPHQPRRVYRRAGLHLERRPRRLHQRQPLRARHRRRPGIPPRTRQQRLHLPRHRPRRPRRRRTPHHRCHVPLGRPHPGPARAASRPEPRCPLPAPPRHPRHLPRHRHRHRRRGLPHRAGHRAEAQ
jgi:malate dehydrogenase (oxaloacetate-decarboxylating)(NADP+)